MFIQQQDESTVIARWPVDDTYLQLAWSHPRDIEQRHPKGLYTICIVIYMCHPRQEGIAYEQDMHLNLLITDYTD